MVALDHDNLLYIDTESDFDTKEGISVQYRFNGENGILNPKNPADYHTLRSLWWQCSAVVMFNAPFDLGALSSYWPEFNSWRWIKTDMGSNCEVNICDHRYYVKVLGGHRNYIRHLNTTRLANGLEPPKHKKGVRSAPIIDVLKLWSIMVEEYHVDGIGLKALVKREFGYAMKERTRETVYDKTYQLDDVIYLEKLWHRFLDKIRDIEDVTDYTYRDWADIKSPATFTKKAYKLAYPELKTYQSMNDGEDKRFDLHNKLEKAYHGGITIALRRGWSHRSVWYDITGAYANTIIHLNTDRWLTYRWHTIKTTDTRIASKTEPVLCKVRTTVMLRSIKSSLKIYRLRTPSINWMWNFDIQAFRLLFPSDTIEIVEAYYPEPTHTIDESLPAKWNRLKDEEYAKNGKTTRREFFKFLSNTSYGIKAQRKPWRTEHTNMVIAGMITSRAHLILFEMVDECQKHGMKWLYSDTDSICMEYSDELPSNFLDTLNTRIAPFKCECEGYDCTTRILSLKRYIVMDGLEEPGKPMKDKIRLHGKSRYRVSQKEIKDALINGIFRKGGMIVGQVAANTERGYNMLMKREDSLITNPHPFMFRTGLPAENLLFEDWFLHWADHCDTKLTAVEDVDYHYEFDRTWHVFDDDMDASIFFNDHRIDDDDIPEDAMVYKRNWDAEIIEDFPSYV